MSLFLTLFACAPAPEEKPDPADTADTGVEGLGIDTTDSTVHDVDTGERETAVVINEFLAYGVDGGYADGADWIEIYNQGGATEDLTGLTLWADDGTDQLVWAFPAGTELPARDYLVVVCDDTNQVGDTLHATFRIGRENGTLYLGTVYDPTSLDAVSYGHQETAVSTGRIPDGSDTWAQLPIPTPGESNGA